MYRLDHGAAIPEFMKSSQALLIKFNIFSQFFFQPDHFFVIAVRGEVFVRSVLVTYLGNFIFPVPVGTPGSEKNIHPKVRSMLYDRFLFFEHPWQPEFFHWDNIMINADLFSKGSV